MGIFNLNSLSNFLSSRLLNIPRNRFHPTVWILGNPKISKGVYIGGFSEINCRESEIFIGEDCDIASFVSINCADSHKTTLGLSKSIQRKPIWIGKNVFIGTHSVVKGGAVIGSYSVIAAGTIVDSSSIIPEGSLVFGNPMKIKKGYYLKKLGNHD